MSRSQNLNQLGREVNDFNSVSFNNIIILSKIIMTDNDVNWQVFRRDSEAGRLLSRLYNTNTSSQRVNYPKAKQRRRPRESGATKTSSSNNDDDQKRPWKTTYTCHGWNKVAEEERESERKINIQRALSLNVPKVGSGRGESRHTINNGINNQRVDQIPRRRSELSCLHDQADIGFANKKYRPPCSFAKSSSEEKQRLARVFDTKGGKCLPEDLTSLPRKEVEEEKVKSHLNRNQNEPDTLFDQIYQEINERRQYQMELETIGAGEETRDRIINEIRIRVEHLKKIDPKRAALIVQRVLK